MDVEILRTSFRMVDDREPGMIARFYGVLFSRYPQVRNFVRPQFASEAADDALSGVGRCPGSP